MADILTPDQCCPMDTYDTDSTGSLVSVCSCPDDCDCFCPGCNCGIGDDSWGDDTEVSQWPASRG